MEDKKLNVSLSEPQLPAGLEAARRNHGGMTVPEDFFLQFERKMNAVIDAEAATQSQEVAKQAPVATLRPRRWLYVAALVAAVVAVSLVLRLNHSVEPPMAEHILAETVATGENTSIDVPEQMADEFVSAASDYEVFDLYCDL